jgi:DMSO/TMAO reductase YedYZ heme-binding membrane subunit
MGGRNWRLRRLIYVTAVAGVVHYWWLVKADIGTRRSMRMRRAAVGVRA